MTFGARVKKRREAFGLSQGQLARRAGITQGLLSRIEGGQTPNPGLQALRGLARALQCSIDHLAGLYEDDDTPTVSPALATTAS